MYFVMAIPALDFAICLFLQSIRTGLKKITHKSMFEPDNIEYEQNGLSLLEGRSYP